MSKAVIYVRVSTAEQVSNYSLDTQREACLAYCRKHGIEVDRVFREEGESAKSADRTQVQEMLRYCRHNAKAKGIDHLIVYKFDRFARQMDDAISLRIEFKRLGIRITAAEEVFDDSPPGNLMKNITLAMAQYDNDMRSERTTAGMKEGLSRGRWMWKPPVGYRRPTSGRSGPSLIPDPESAPLVLRAFELASTGQMSMRDLWDRMTVLDLRTVKRKRLSLQAFGELLKNPIYMGRVVSPKLGVDWPGDFPLRRLVRCGLCNGPLTGSWSTGRSARYGYYRCHQSGCRGVNVRKERLEGP